MTLAVREIQFGNRQIGFAVRRSAVRTTTGIAVSIADGIVVTAPAALADQEIDQIVHQKARWLVERLADLAEVEPEPPLPEFVGGETFAYLGRQYRLRIVPAPDASRVDVRLRSGWLTATVPSGLNGSDASAAIRKELPRWYRRRASDLLPKRTETWAQRLGVDSPRVLVRDQQKRWGSCTRDGRLRINWRIMMAPTMLVDYVLAHELCHLQVPNHSKRFWALLGTIMPDYARRRERLRVEGGGFRLRDSKQTSDRTGI